MSESDYTLINGAFIHPGVEEFARPDHEKITEPMVVAGLIELYKHPAGDEEAVRAVFAAMSKARLAS